MQYIREPKPEHSACVLCDYCDCQPTRQSLVLVQQPDCFVVLNKYPYVSSHLMVVSRRHVSDMADLTSSQWTALWHAVREASTRLCSATKAQGLNVGLNLGVVAGAGIDQHLHVHLVPRWQGDNNFMPVIADARVLPEYLEETWDYLRPHFEDLDGVRGAPR